MAGPNKIASPFQFQSLKDITIYSQAIKCNNITQNGSNNQRDR